MPCSTKFFSLMLSQVWLELLKPITKQVKSKYGKSLKRCNSQLQLEKVSMTPCYSSPNIRGEKGFDVLF